MQKLGKKIGVCRHGNIWNLLLYTLFRVIWLAFNICVMQTCRCLFIFFFISSTVSQHVFYAIIQQIKHSFRLPVLIENRYLKFNSGKEFVTTLNSHIILLSLSLPLTFCSLCSLFFCNQGIQMLIQNHCPYFRSHPSQQTIWTVQRRLIG